MKKTLLILSFSLAYTLVHAQLSVENTDNGGVTISPKGIVGKNNTSGNPLNVAYGQETLASNTFGANNTALGYWALRLNTTGNNNAAAGYIALTANVGGSNNAAFGSQALQANTTGNSNAAFGYFALYSNIEGSNNTAIGRGALSSNIYGSNNTALGFQSVSSNETGANNTGIGTYAVFSNSSGQFNTGVGARALEGGSVGDENTGIGASALVGNSTGSGNTAVGRNSLSNALTAGGNTAVGLGAGASIITGSNNTFLGKYADASGDYTNATAIGANAMVNASNKVRLGNANVTVVEGPVAYTFPSDRRLKENISYNTSVGLNFILKLQPVSYTYIADKSKIRHDGFIAQDVEKVMKDLGVPFSGVKKSADGMYSLAYSDFVMPLVNAVKEQQEQIQDLKKQNQLLLERLLKMDEKLSKIAASASTAETK